jgi:hypothetical protein
MVRFLLSRWARQPAGVMPRDPRAPASACSEPLRAEYRNHYCMAFEFRDGRIRAVREYLDTAHVRNALL